MNNSSKYNSYTAFVDLIFNTLLGFTTLFLVSFCFINLEKIKQQKTVDVKAVMIITVEWPPEMDDDVDTYVKDPLDNILFFQAREVGFMLLDRDDQGLASDVILTRLGYVQVKQNREFVTIRKFLEGTYIINIHMYNKKTDIPTPVSVEVTKINPYEVIVSKTILLDKKGQEETVVSFDIDKQGNIFNISEEKIPIVGVQR